MHSERFLFLYKWGLGPCLTRFLPRVGGRLNVAAVLLFIVRLVGHYLPPVATKEESKLEDHVVQLQENAVRGDGLYRRSKSSLLLYRLTVSFCAHYFTLRPMAVDVNEALESKKSR